MMQKYKTYYVSVVKSDGKEPEDIARVPVLALWRVINGDVSLDFKEEKTVSFLNTKMKPWVGASIAIFDSQEGGNLLLSEYIGTCGSMSQLEYKMSMSEAGLRERIAELEARIAELEG